MSSVGYRPRGCGECLGRALGFDAAVALWLVDPGPDPEHLRLGPKHATNGWVAPWLGRLLVEARPFLREEVDRSASVRAVPVPLHWRRYWARGIPSG